MDQTQDGQSSMPVAQPAVPGVVPPGSASAPPSIPSVPVPPIPTPPKLKEQAPFADAQGKPIDSAQGKPFDTPVDKPADTVAGPNSQEADKVAKEEGDEYWENYAREIELEKEIMEMGGVEKVESGEVKVPEDLAREMGIKPTVGPTTPIAEATGFSIRGVTLSDHQLALGLKKPTSSGFRWLVEWFIYQLLKAHYHIKRIKGKIFREGLGTSS